MDLRRDERGRPIGLNWPKIDPSDPSPSQSQAKPKLSPLFVENVGAGRPQQDLCNAGLHKMSEHGVPIIKNGKQKGRYCRACKSKRQAEYRAAKPEQYRQYNQNYYKRKREREAQGGFN